VNLGAGHAGRGLAVAVATLGLAGAPADRPTVERAIEIPRPGRVAVVLDRDVYESARADLADLRVVDGEDRPVPYLLERALEEPPAVRSSVILNRGFVRGQSATVTLDFEGPVLKRDLVLSLSGDNFRRRVIVEGKGKHDDAWTTLTDTAYVFAVPPSSAAVDGAGTIARRYETVALPENNQQFLKVTVMRGADETGEVEIREVRAGTAASRRPREVPLTPRLVRTEDIARRETLLTLDLGARHQPFRAVSLEVADPRFFRGVTLEARPDPVPTAPAGTPPPPWRALAECAIYRYEEPGRTVESLRIEVPGRERAIRLRIHNRDDEPLDVRGVSVGVPVERLAFEAAPASRYRLRYGAPGLGAPAYDLPRTVGDVALWTATAGEARLQTPVRVRALSDRPAWTERHPALLWVGLVATVVLLGLVTRRALRAAG
jgi:Protein of unknown function (DUF3999)